MKGFCNFSKQNPDCLKESSLKQFNYYGKYNYVNSVFLCANCFELAGISLESPADKPHRGDITETTKQIISKGFHSRKEIEELTGYGYHSIVSAIAKLEKDGFKIITEKRKLKPNVITVFYRLEVKNEQ